MNKPQGCPEKCPFRSVGCHSDCPIDYYPSYLIKLKRYNEAVRKGKFEGKHTRGIWTDYERMKRRGKHNYKNMN